MKKLPFSYFNVCHTMYRCIICVNRTFFGVKKSILYLIFVAILVLKGEIACHMGDSKKMS